MNWYRRFRDAAVCVVLLALPFLVLRSNLKSPGAMNAVDRSLLQITAPIQFVAARLALSVSGVWQEYMYLVDVGRDNDRLRADNARLREANFQLQAAALENHSMRRLLQLREEVKGSLLSAQVVGATINPYFLVKRLTLDRGDSDHVREGMAVLTPDGLVGQILRTAGRTSDVLLLADKNSAVDIMVQRTRARGMLKGTGNEHSYICRIEHLVREDDVKVGDVVVTSGFGQRFPASILVGRISEVKKKNYGLYQEASVVPAVNFSRLEQVMVSTSGSRSQSLGASHGAKN